MKSKKFLIAASAAVVIIVIVLIETLTPGFVWLFTPSGKAQSGVLDDVGGTEHISRVPEGEIRYLINNNVLVEASGRKGNFMFENPEACKYDIQFIIYEIVGDGEKENVLYTSPVIKPGEYLFGDKLDKRVKKGKYNCIYIVRAFDDGEYVGERTGDLTLTVQKVSF